jgi:glycosyltransferase involved in cell wall biosynthesis
MKILQTGNANFGYVIARELRKRGIESDLLISKQIISGKGNTVNDPLNLEKDLSDYPDWVHFYDLQKAGWKTFILKEMRKYDLIHAYMELPIFAMFSLKPYVAQSGGDDLRDLAFQNTLRGRLLRMAYKKAKAFVYVWPPHRPYVNKLGITNATYIPRIWDTSNFVYTKYTKNENKHLIIFHPTGQDWEMKGNDKFLRAFVRLCKEQKDVFLYYVRWGKDAEKADRLLDNPDVKKRMEIVDGPISRQKMAEYMQKSDILAEQFNSGSFTRTGIESFMFGIPLMVNLDEDLHRDLHGEAPPVINVKNEEAIYEKLSYFINSKDELIDYSEKSNQWGRKHFDLVTNVTKFIQIYENIILK